GGALDAEGDRAVEPEQAALAHPARGGEVGGRRGQALGARAVAAADRAVADRAVSREVGGGRGQVGHLAGGDADLVDIDDATAEIAGDGRDLFARALVPDCREEPGRAGFERGALGAGGQARDHGADAGRELDLLVVLALVEHLAVLHRSRVVHAQVVERVQDGSERIRLGGASRAGGEADREDQRSEHAGETTRQRLLSLGVTAIASLPTPARRAASMTSTTRPCRTSVSASITTASSGSVRARAWSRAESWAGSTGSRSR